MLKVSGTSSQGAVGFELRGTDYFLPRLMTWAISKRELYQQILDLFCIKEEMYKSTSTFEYKIYWRSKQAQV